MSIQDLRGVYAEVKKHYKSDHDLTVMGTGLLNSGKMNEALGVFNQALDRKPNSYDALKGKGWASVATGDAVEAQRCFRRALAEYPQGDKDTWKAMGELAIKEKRLPEAIHYYEKAERWTSTYHKAEYGQLLVRLGWLYSETGQLSQTRRIFTRALGFLEGQEFVRVKALLAKLEAQTDQAMPTPAGASPAGANLSNAAGPWA